MNIAVLISGRGSNMLALHQAIQKGSLKNVALSLVISSHKEAAGLAKAKRLGLPTVLIDRSQFNSRRDFENQLIKTIQQQPIDLLVLAGFMQVLSPEFVACFAPNIINIHPSLLPKYKGLNTHRRVLAAKDSKHGLTIHMVTADLDSGPTIMQKEIHIANNATEESLAADLLVQEHLFLPLVIQLIAWQDIKLTKKEVFCQDQHIEGIRWNEQNDAIMKIQNDENSIVIETNRNENIKEYAKIAEGHQERESAQELLNRAKRWLLEQDSNLRPIG